MRNMELLNAIQSKLIEFANENGIDLHEVFGTVDKFKRFVIAFTFKSLTDVGVDTKDAYDIIFGDGSYDTLAETVWNAAQHN